MRASFVFAATLAAISLSITVEAAPIANLPLTCPSSAAIGQSQNNCSGLIYQQPSSDQLIVLRSNATWARASTLASADTLTVCAIPVEPGTYSSCRDSGGVRRLVQIPKSQIFANSPPPPPPGPSGRTIDLSRTPLEISLSGSYVFDRNWNATSTGATGAIVITADDVTLDLQGFTLTVDGTGIRSSGRNVTIRNGTVTVSGAGDGGAPIETSGASTTVESMRASTPRGGQGVSVAGVGSIVTRSIISTGIDGAGVAAGNDATVTDNQISSPGVAIQTMARNTVSGNQLYCGNDCVVLQFGRNIVSGNRVRGFNPTYAPAVAFQIYSDENQVFDNVLMPTCTAGQSGAAIHVTGQRNLIRGNLVPACNGVAIWAGGVVFRRDGNFYGDNIVWATVPFDVGATVQTDLGGNVGFMN